MFLVTNCNFVTLMKDSRISSAEFTKMDLYYGTLEEILKTYCKDYKTAEMYWKGSSINTVSIVLKNNGIEPVRNVNKLQPNTTILIINDIKSAELLVLRKVVTK